MLSKPWRALFPFLLTGLITTMAHAEMPEGTAIPTRIDVPGNTHSEGRIAVYIGTHTYRYHADYNVTNNFGDPKKIAGYVMADADIEASIFNGSGEFHPDRLAGTFELGAVKSFGTTAGRLFLRHQSVHNIDRTDRRRPAWEMLGFRVETKLNSTNVEASLGAYSHREAVFYDTDVDIRSSTPIGEIGNHTIALDTYFHYVHEHGGPRSGFADYWIEPSVRVNKNTSIYLGLGTAHDIDTSNGNSEHPIILGANFNF